MSDTEAESLNLHVETEATPVEAVAAGSAAATPQVETPAVETKTETAPEDDRLRRGFAALGKKEKALREKEKQIARLEGLEKKAKESPLEFLQEFGLSYDQLTDLILGNEGEEKPAPTADDRVAALEARIEAERVERENAAKLQTQADIERKINTFKEGVLKHGLKSEPDKYELINARGDDGAELVWEVIESYYEANNSVLNWQDAADHVEKHLETEARALLKLKRFATAAPAAAPANDQGATTLSRSNSSEMPVTGGDEDYSLDPDTRTQQILSKNRFWA